MMQLSMLPGTIMLLFCVSSLNYSKFRIVDRLDEYFSCWLTILYAMLISYKTNWNGWGANGKFGINAWIVQ